MRRRKFIILVGSIAIAPATQVCAQQKGVRRIGFLSPASGPGPNHAAFLEQLRKLGYIEGKNLIIHWKWINQRYDLFPQAAFELCQQNIELLVAQTQAAALAAKAATQTIPIVFVGVRDPVFAGLVPRLNQPGGNITGVTLTPNPELAAKMVELLREVVPKLSRLAIMWNPQVKIQGQVIEEIKSYTKSDGVAIRPFGVQRLGDIERAFESMKQEGIEALLTLVESFTLANRALLARLAIDHRIPTIFEVREYVDAGGLLSYGVQYKNHYAKAAIYVVRVLKGEKPSDMPIEQPSLFDLVVNTNTARSLGLELPVSLLARATDVVE